MTKGRMEAFSDGVLAVFITIMVLDMKPPHDTGLPALRPLIPVFLSYILSFIYVGIYWNNHHHLLQATRHISGAALWANLHLMFWLSLIPFTTAWVGENHLKPWREPFEAVAGGVVRDRPAMRGYRVLHSDQGSHPPSWTRLGVGEIGRRGQKGQDFHCCVCSRSLDGVCAAMDCLCWLRDCRHHVAGP